MSTADRLIVACLAAFLVAAITILAIDGKDTAVLVSLCGPAVSGLFGLLLVRHTSAVRENLKQVADATNGKLDAVLDKLQNQSGEK